MLAVWRDISLMWLIFLSLLLILPLSVAFFYAIKGMHRLRQVTKTYLPLAQAKARLVADKTDEIGQRVTGPIITTKARIAQVNGLARATFTRRKSA